MINYKKAGFNTLNEMFNSMLNLQKQGKHKEFIKLCSSLTKDQKISFVERCANHEVFAGAMKDLLGESLGLFSVDKSYADCVLTSLMQAGFIAYNNGDTCFPDIKFNDSCLIEGSVNLLDKKVSLHAVDGDENIYNKEITYTDTCDLIEHIKHFQKDIQETISKCETVIPQKVVALSDEETENLLQYSGWAFYLLHEQEIKEGDKLFNSAVKSAIQDPSFAASLLELKIIKEGTELFEEAVKIVLQKGTDESIFNLLIKLIIKEGTPYFNSAVERVSKDSDSAFALIIKGVVKEGSDLYNKVKESALQKFPQELLEQKETQQPNTNDLNKKEDLCFNLNKKSDVSLKEKVKTMLQDSWNAFEVLLSGKFIQEGDLWEIAAESAIRERDYAFNLVDQGIIKEDSPYYKKALKSAIRKEYYALDFLLKGVIKKGMDLFEEALKSAIRRNDYANKLVQKGIITQEELEEYTKQPSTQEQSNLGDINKQEDLCFTFNKVADIEDSKKVLADYLRVSPQVITSEDGINFKINDDSALSLNVYMVKEERVPTTGYEINPYTTLNNKNYYIYTKTPTDKKSSYPMYETIEKKAYMEPYGGPYTYNGPYVMDYCVYDFEFFEEDLKGIFEPEYKHPYMDLAVYFYGKFYTEEDYNIYIDLPNFKKEIIPGDALGDIYVFLAKGRSRFSDGETEILDKDIFPKLLSNKKFQDFLQEKIEGVLESERFDIGEMMPHVSNPQDWL